MNDDREARRAYRVALLKKVDEFLRTPTRQRRADNVVELHAAHEEGRGDDSARRGKRASS